MSPEFIPCYLFIFFKVLKFFHLLKGFLKNIFKKTKINK